MFPTVWDILSLSNKHHLIHHHQSDSSPHIPTYCTALFYTLCCTTLHCSAYCAALHCTVFHCNVIGIILGTKRVKWKLMMEGSNSVMNISIHFNFKQYTVYIAIFTFKTPGACRLPVTHCPLQIWSIINFTVHCAQNWRTIHKTAQHGTIPHNTAQHGLIPHNSTQHSTISHNPAQHGTIPHNTAQHCTTQHNTAQPCTSLNNTSKH